MNIQSRYLKFQIPYNIINKILEDGKYKRIIFHVDLPSITRGFYNRQVIEYELSEYVESQNLPTYFLKEAKQFFGNLFNRYRQYSPMFNIFYDNGNCGQNNMLLKGYKDRTHDRSRIILEDLDMELYSKIKHYYYEEFYKLFNISKLSSVIFLKEYEADFIPWIMLKFDIWNCTNKECLNIILSLDKDLLQCCQFGNVIQIFTLYSKSGSGIIFNVYDDMTAINQLYDKAERGILTSKFVPTVLSLSGDKADKIPGIPKIGEANAYKLIIKHNLPFDLTYDFKWPQELEEYKKIVVRNYKIISFEEQFRRLPIPVQNDIKTNLIQRGI